jgi:DNA-binding NarL/FixJ family response regulator
MPGRNGLEILQQLKDEGINVPVLILSFHPEEHMALRAFRSGAYGYLNKAFAGDELISAVNKIRSGRKYISAASAEQLALQLENPQDNKPHELLSNREYQIALLIALGKTVSQIAGLLSLSVTTISTYRARILEKMNMKTNAELTTYSIRQQLV